MKMHRAYLLRTVSPRPFLAAMALIEARRLRAELLELEADATAAGAL